MAKVGRTPFLFWGSHFFFLFIFSLSLFGSLSFLWVRGKGTLLLLPSPKPKLIGILLSFAAIACRWLLPCVCGATSGVFMSQQQCCAPALRASSHGLRVLAQKAARDVSATEHISGVANCWADRLCMRTRPVSQVCLPLELSSAEGLYLHQRRVRISQGFSCLFVVLPLSWCLGSREYGDDTNAVVCQKLGEVRVPTRLLEKFQSWASAT